MFLSAAKQSIKKGECVACCRIILLVYWRVTDVEVLGYFCYGSENQFEWVWKQKFFIQVKLSVIFAFFNDLLKARKVQLSADLNDL